MRDTSFNKMIVSTLLFFLLAFSFTQYAQAQNDPAFAAERERAIQLINQRNFSEALPLLEKLSTHKEADGQIFLGIGLAYWESQKNVTDEKQRKNVRLKARTAILKAREMGASIPEVDLLVATIKPDGGDRDKSDNPQAQAAYNQAYPAFAAGNYSSAVAAYEKAATLDPTWYEAALYTGNTYYAMKDYQKAGVWFAKAIAIDPNRETAYRYWGDALMLNGKNEEAEDKFFDAIIAEPYNSSSWRGISQYAQRNDIKLAHPKINIPVNIASTDKGNTNITLGIGDKSDDGSFAWMMYGLSRAGWQVGKDGKLSEKFVAAYPQEKIYRHSLAEETAALRSVLLGLKNGGKEVKNLDKSLAILKKLDEMGLLEAYLLFARADPGIKRDYEAYRQNNREKLKRYLAEVLVQTNNF